MVLEDCNIPCQPFQLLSSYLISYLLLQIDAAINSGNSGGPAFNDKGKCVGIAFQSLKHEDVENIGYVIPTPVIMHFIQDYEKNGAYTGNIVTVLACLLYSHFACYGHCIIHFICN